MSFYENFDIKCINIRQKNDKRSPLGKYKGLYYWILHQSLTDDVVGESDTVNFDYNGETIDWGPFLSSLDSLRILGILRPILKGKNSSKRVKWIELSKVLISQITNLLFVERNKASHIIKCISIIARFSSYSLSNGRFDDILLSLDSEHFTSPIDTAHIIKGYIKAKRFEPLLYLKLLNHIEYSSISTTDKNTAIAISLNAISEYWWYLNEINFSINDLIHPKDAVSITNVIGKFEVSNELKYKVTKVSSNFISRIIENPSKYDYKDLLQACKSLTFIALINPKNEKLIQIIRKVSLLDILSGPPLIDILSAHILIGIIPPIDLVVKCVIQLKHARLCGDYISKLKLITHITGYSALGFKRTLKKTLSSINSTNLPSIESYLITYYLNGKGSKFPILSNFKFDNLNSITKFQVLSKTLSILKQDYNGINHILYQYALDSSKIFLSVTKKPKWLIEHWSQILLSLEKFKIKGLAEVEEIIYNNLEKVSKSSLFMSLKLSLLKLNNGYDVLWDERYLKTLQVISTSEILAYDISFLKNTILSGLESSKLLIQNINECLKLTERKENPSDMVKFCLKERNLKLLTCILNEDKCNNGAIKLKSIWNLIVFIAIKSHPCFTKIDIFHAKPIEIALMANLYTVSTPIMKVRHNLYWVLDSSNFPRKNKNDLQIKCRPKILTRFFRRRKR